MDDRRHIAVAPSNTAQAKAWDGDEGAFWARQADRFDRAVAGYRQPFLEAAGIGSADRVLDVGCGCGETTLDAAHLADGGTALGVDLSSAMLEVARRRASDQGIANASFEQADAQVYAFELASFDLAISRTGAMFFGEPVAAFTNIGTALRPGGRLTLLAWQPLTGNEWIREFSGALAAGRDMPPPPPDAPGPFALSDPQRVEHILGAAGFDEIRLDPVEAPMWFGDTADDACEFVLGVSGWMLEGLDDESRSRALGALRSSIESHTGSTGVLYASAAWLIRARKG
ncbi:class I SAM-dependent methyltransferase [Rhabdothermincola sp.]|uniref:class I SAM-dependent methyltransferase n=1 Tax=Rhabdothermincola sp. TaxID=2820405 RepID=UPI002FE0DF33